MTLVRFITLLITSFIAASATAERGDGLRDPRALELGQLVHLEQNWNADERRWFYFIDQGSRLIPYDVFVNLEQADNDALFREPLYLLGFGLIPAAAGADNPDALAIGLTRGDDHLGFTCAACHTQQIEYGGAFLRIDGGQAMFDLQAFLLALEAALAANLEDPAKFARFSARSTDTQPTEAQSAEIRARLASAYSKIKTLNVRNQTDNVYGFTRLDAFGAILNKALALTGVADNANPPDGPTSYPYLWDTPQHDYVEWDGSQSNADIGSLARNVGEVIGVFGEVDPTPQSWALFFDGGYVSSVHASNLRAIEMHLATLQSPQWPARLPAINSDKATRGRALFETHCLSCHLDIDRADPNRLIQSRMSTLDTIGTDPVMARNALERRGDTGIFEGRPRYYAAGDAMGAEEPALYVLNNIMGGVLTNNPLQSLLAIREAGELGHPDEIHPPKFVNGSIIARGEEVSERALLAYKARPLNGVWTSAPFLHNGSVPNLYELLLPAAERSITFHVGTWRFDPERVGYVSEPGEGTVLIDTRLRGNSNAGHEYGTGANGSDALSDADRWALIEYLKTL